jgi:hypothetical protein
MIGKSKTLFLNTWIIYGVHILQIGLLMIITRNANNFFTSSGVPVQQVSTHLGLHGNALIIG